MTGYFTRERSICGRRLGVGRRPAFERCKPQFELVETVPKQRDLCLEAELAFGTTLDSWRTPSPVDDRIERDKPLWAIGTVDEPRRDLAVSVPRSQR